MPDLPRFPPESLQDPGRPDRAQGEDLASDGDLLAASARGDRAALARLYDRHAPWLLGLGTRLLGDRTAAEEVLHELFLELWQDARRFRGPPGTVRAHLLARLLRHARAPGGRT
jgi:RNA polymerase sigma-70 factor (ECF subfamily)